MGLFQAFTMSTQPLHDANEQTGIDMSNARASSTVVVENVRDFLHRKFGSCSILPHIIIIIDLPPSVDGRDEWLAHSRIVNILQNDPVFDKSQRYCIVLQLNDQITDPPMQRISGENREIRTRPCFDQPNIRASSEPWVERATNQACLLGP